MYKKCDICGAKTVFSEGDDDSNLKIVKIANPDTGEITEKLCCLMRSRLEIKKILLGKCHNRKR